MIQPVLPESMMLSNAETIIKIDHHPNDEEYGDLVWVDTTFSSVSETVVVIFAEVKPTLNYSDQTTILCLLESLVILVASSFQQLLPVRCITSQLREYDFWLCCTYTSYMDKQSAIKSPDFKVISAIILVVDENGAARVILTQEILWKKYDADAETAAIVGAPGRIDTVSLWGIF